jgi:pyruvate formate lyase activating enzyme
LSNLVSLLKQDKVTIIPRIPLVPHITATPENITSIAHFLKSANCTACELLSYNSGGIAKRHSLGKAVPEILIYLKFDIGAEKKCRGIFDCHLPNRTGAGNDSIIKQSA